MTTLKSRTHKILAGYPELFPDYIIREIANLNAVLDHAGMFLRRDGVHRLIRNYRCLEGFEEKAWKASWLDYVDETRRLSQERMRYHFGSSILVDEKCINKDALDDDLRVIGEFLR